MLTPEEKQAQAAGYALPEGDELISGGDDAIRQNAALNHKRINGLTERLQALKTTRITSDSAGNYRLLNGLDQAFTIYADEFGNYKIGQAK
ncbi:hypothetical protein ACUIAJ_03890 [Dermabacteraceae bacterium CCM 9519]